MSDNSSDWSSDGEDAAGSYFPDVAPAEDSQRSKHTVKSACEGGCGVPFLANMHKTSGKFLIPKHKALNDDLAAEVEKKLNLPECFIRKNRDAMMKNLSKEQREKRFKEFILSFKKAPSGDQIEYN